MRLRKSIKKIINLFWWLLLIASLIILLLFSAVHIPYVQNRVISETKTILEAKLGNHIQFRTVRLRPLNTLRFKDLYISDIDSDTLLFAGECDISLKGILPTVVAKQNEKLMIKKIHVDSSYIRFYVDTTNRLNLSYFIDVLLPQDTTRQKSPFRINEINLSNSKLKIQRFDAEYQETGLNPADMMLSNLNLKVRRFLANQDTVSMDIRDLSAVEKSGFGINRLRARFEVGRTFMHFNRLFLETFNSRIEAHKVLFEFSNIKDFRYGYYGTNVHNTFIINESTLNTADIGYFTKPFYNYNQLITISGNVGGYLRNLNGQDLTIKYGNSSELKGNFDINGLPKGSETFIVFDLTEFHTNAYDLEHLNLPGAKQIVFPENLKGITQLSYKGNFTGFFTDFVSYGTLTTNQGKIQTDIMIQPDTAGAIKVTGLVSSQDFEVGPLFGLENLLGKISLNAQISGAGQPGKGFDTQITGDISSFEINHYNYANIHIDGRVAQRKFNGLLTINDPNLHAEFDGLVDLSSSIRQYNFTTNVTKANLYQLKLNKTDPDYQASFILEANAAGKNLNEFNGQINLVNSLFSRGKKQIQVYGMNLLVDNDSTRNQLRLNSDILNASIVGTYQTLDLPQYFKQIINGVLPALQICPDSNCVAIDANNAINFNYYIKCNRIKPILDFFLPSITVAEQTFVQGNYSTKAGEAFNLHMESPSIGIGTNIMQNLILNITKAIDTLSIDVGSQTLYLSERLKLENFNFESIIANDSATVQTRWLNWDTVLYKGNLYANCKFEKRKPGHPSISVDFSPSNITLADTSWQFDAFGFIIDTNYLEISNFSVRNGAQSLALNGKLSADGQNNIDFSFRQFDLSQLNIFMRNKTMSIEGIIKAEGQIEGNMFQPKLSAEIDAQSVVLNARRLGDIHLFSQWNNAEKAVFIDGFTQSEKHKNLVVKGYYKPQDEGEIDMTWNFDQFKIDAFKPYLRRTFHEVDGLVSGQLVIDGIMSNPSINGQVRFEEGIIGLDYLKTVYYVSDKIDVVNNNFILNQLEFKDAHNKKGYINGTIHLEKLRDLLLDLQINVNGIHCLNTTVQDNPTYYGTATADGIVRLSGPTNNLHIDITGRTGSGTQLNIPVGNTGTISDFDFITFYNNDTTASASEPINFNQDNSSTLSLDFNMHVTPDAEVQIIFDPKLGDIIRTTGEGDLRFTIDNNGNFKMMGEYIIDRGDYLFTLQNVINKKFKVKQGSSLRWSGHPLNASIDIEAYYRTKASLYGLFGYDVEGSHQYQSRTTVDCELLLAGNLLEPQINYNIYLPFAETETRDRVQSRIADEEKLGKQFLSLLVLNSFYLDDPNTTESSSEDGNNNQRIANVNASELLSNQLSNWLSQISDDVDIGVNYRPGDNISSSEVELALSTQLLNDQLSVNGSVDMRTNAEASNVNQVVGDIDVDYKLTKSGKVRFRAFNRSNDDQIRNYSPYTQGFGIYFVEEFNSLDELWDRYTQPFQKKSHNGTPSADTLINNQNP